VKTYQIRAMMREAQSIVDSFKAEEGATTEEKRAAASSQQITFLSAEIESLDRLISLLEAGVEVAERGEDVRS
jgi:hypothetical protein